jgi:hypothetical protein
MRIRRSYVACAACACLVRCCIHNMRMPCKMLHSQNVQSLSDDAFTICAYLVRCCIHNKRITCQMLHSQYAHTLSDVAFTISAYLVRCCMRYMRIPCQMMRAQFADTLSDVACAICAHLLQTNTFCRFSIGGLELQYIMLRRQNAGISATAPKLTLNFLVKVKKSGG